MTKKPVPKRLQTAKKVTHIKSNPDGTKTMWSSEGYVGKIAAPRKPKGMGNTKPSGGVGSPGGEELSPVQGVGEAFVKLESVGERPSSVLNERPLDYIASVEFFKGVGEFKEENPEFYDPTELFLAFQKGSTLNEVFSDEKFISLINKTVFRGRGQKYEDLPLESKAEVMESFADEFFPTAKDDAGFALLVSKKWMTFNADILNPANFSPGKFENYLTQLKPVAKWSRNVRKHLEEVKRG